MKVWILEYSDYDTHGILGVYATQEAAQDAHDNNPDSVFNPRRNWSVEEYEVQTGEHDPCQDHGDEPGCVDCGDGSSANQAGVKP